MHALSPPICYVMSYRTRGEEFILLLYTNAEGCSSGSPRRGLRYVDTHLSLRINGSAGGPTSFDSNLYRSDSNLFQPVDYSPDEALVENVNPSLSDECSVLSSDTKNEAILHTSVRHPSESDQTESDTSACLSDDVCLLTRDTSPPFLCRVRH